MTLPELHRIVYLPIKWMEVKHSRFSHVGYLTDDITFNIEIKHARMVHLIPPDSLKPLNYPSEDAAMDGALVYAIENWVSILDNHLSQRRGQLDLFGSNSYRLTIEQYEALGELPTQELEEAYVLKKKGQVPGLEN